MKAFAEAARKRMTAKPEQPLGPRYYDDDYESRQPAPVHPSELLFATLCLADPALVAHGEGAARAAARPRPGDPQHRVPAPHPRGVGPARGDAGRRRRTRWPTACRRGGTPRPPRSVWFAQDGYLVQAWNDQPSFLLLDTPLTGTFEFSVDAFQGACTEGHVGYAGVVFEPNRDGVAVVGLAGRQARDRSSARRTASAPTQFNRLTRAGVARQGARACVNGQLFYEDTDPPPTSPWVMLYAGAGPPAGVPQLHPDRQARGAWPR